MNAKELIPCHGGYRKLKSFQIAQLVYDVTVRFCDLYVERYSRTRDQMVQAARSGVQNIAEGSVASATSKKTELKLTNVAKASLEELKLDYEDFLRQKGMELLKNYHPVLMRFKAKQCRSVEEIRSWVKEEKKFWKQENQGPTRTIKDRQGPSRTDPKSVQVSEGPCESVNSSFFVANAALSLLNLAIYLLKKQIIRLADEFENNGGCTERLYKVRKEKFRHP